MVALGYSPNEDYLLGLLDIYASFDSGERIMEALNHNVVRCRFVAA